MCRSVDCIFTMICDQSHLIGSYLNWPNLFHQSMRVGASIVPEYFFYDILCSQLVSYHSYVITIIPEIVGILSECKQ